jgi:hypothetical protein
MTTHYAAVLGDVPRLVRQSLDGAVTTGIVPGREERTPAIISPTPADDEPTFGGNLLARAWRFVAGPVARPKAVEGSPS